MALSNIALSSGMRNNLLAMQGTANLMNTTSERLGTGKKVNSALDNASAYFASQSHMQRANDLDARKDGMSEAIQTIKAADAGIEGITTMVEQIKGLVNDSVGASTEVQTANQASIQELVEQINAMVSDSGYKGTNLLLDGDTEGTGVPEGKLTVYFNESGDSYLEVIGKDLGALGLGLGDTSDASVATTIDVLTDTSQALTDINDALNSLRSASTQLSANLGVITARQEFTSNMMNTLQIGADNLTLADLNEEGANMLALQTQQQLSTSALSLASQASQSVLRLF